MGEIGNAVALAVVGIGHTNVISVLVLPTRS